MGRFSYIVFLLIFAGFALAACADRTPPPVVAAAPPVVDPNIIIDPSSNLFMGAIQDYVASLGAPADSRYEFTRIDLDHDGRRDGIVIMKSPHQYWCGMEGCKMVVFKAANDSFSLVSEIAPVRGPLVVSASETNGWRDLLLRISGRSYEPPRNVILRYDGHAYPAVPDYGPSVLLASIGDVDGVRIFP